MHSIRIFDLDNEGQGCWRFGWKLAGERVLSVRIRAQKLALLDAAIFGTYWSDSDRFERL